jgi:hypothetical protein
VLNRALAKSPAERFPTCQAFVSALRDAISGVVDERHSPAVGRPSLPAPQSYPPVSRPPTSQPPFSQPPSSQPPSSHPPSSHPPVSQPPMSQPQTYGQQVYAAPTMDVARGAAQGTPPGKIPGKRKIPVGPLIGGLAVLVSMAVAATLILTKGGDTTTAWRAYPGTVAAPFTMAYPSAWGDAKTSADQWMIASPATEEFDALFAVPGNGDWSKVDPIIANRPERAAGVFAQVSNTLSTSDSPEELQDGLKLALPGTVAYTSAPAPTTVGAKPAFQIGGVMNDPQQGGRLDFSAYLVRQDTGETSVLITFFCPPARCDQQLIAHMINTVTFTS